MRTGHQSYLHWPLDAPLRAVQRLPPAVTLTDCASPCHLATRCRRPPLSAPRRTGHPPATAARPSTCVDAGLHSAHIATGPTAPQPDPAGSRHLGWIHSHPCRGAPPSLSSPSSRSALCLLRQPLPQAPPPSGRLDLSRGGGGGGRICPHHPAMAGSTATYRRLLLLAATEKPPGVPPLGFLMGRAPRRCRPCGRLALPTSLSGGGEVVFAVRVTPGTGGESLQGLSPIPLLIQGKVESIIVIVAYLFCHNLEIGL